ncbi:MAG: DUF1294 domain-containing protein [Burkholderiales bacterium]|nr:MAG: DUF1294 domain-containing protein [Burkholderiales bacterium]
MTKAGTIVRWDDSRGFGFIQGRDSRTDIFFHAKDFHGSALPRVGMLVEFEEIHVGGKGPRATAVRPAETSQKVVTSGATQRPPQRNSRPVRARQPLGQARDSGSTPSRARASVPPRKGHAVGAFVAMFLWTCLLAAGIRAGRLPMVSIGLVLLLNLFTFVVYWTDKHAAQHGRWRVAESTLHLFGVAGGWPGAWMAQQTLRHKSSKASFRAVYRGTVVLNIAALAGWIYWSAQGLPEWIRIPAL